jgi:1,2-diacylglycerol-3-alpha-glucose alpha-1,2-galactosyltransferase
MKMQRMIDRSPKNMVFAGIVPLENMPSYYHAADMFWLPSEQETFGLVVVEAAASGLPIMLRDIADYDTTFGDDAIKHTSIASVEKNIELLRDDSKAYKKWAQGAIAIAKRFDSHATADQLVKLYQSLL